MTPIPHTKFTTNCVENDIRYDLFRDSISVLFEVEAEKTRDLLHFEANIDAYLYDQVLIAKCQSQAADYIRTSKKIRSDCNDSIMLQLFLEGNTHFSSDSDRTNIEAGDIVVFDLAKPATNHNTNFTHISVLFPRELLESYIPTASKWHGQVLPRRNPMTRLLGNHIMTLHEVGNEVDLDASKSMQRSLLELASSALQTHIDTWTPCLDATLLMEIKKFIRHNLSNPTLSVDSLCAHFSLSRASLYRITEPLGGISHFIKIQRLKRAFMDIQDPKLNHLTITQITYNLGFNDTGTFTRVFKKHFGFLPKDLRNAGNAQLLVAQKTQNSDPNREYEKWVQALAY